MQYEIHALDRFKIVRITGNIDTDSSTKVLDDEISRISEQEGKHHFVFDLEATDYLDSAGISIFIHCLCDANENGGSVAIIAGDNQVRRVLEMVGLTRLIPTYESIDAFCKAQEVAAC